jgi:hypothetical protein
MPNTIHKDEVSTTEARQGRRRTGLLSVMGIGILIALVGMLLALALTGTFSPSGV